MLEKQVLTEACFKANNELWHADKLLEAKVITAQERLAVVNRIRESMGLSAFDGAAIFEKDEK